LQFHPKPYKIHKKTGEFMLVDELNSKMVESFSEKFKKFNLKEPDKNIVIYKK